jgi:hypothetical protein
MTIAVVLLVGCLLGGERLRRRSAKSFRSRGWRNTHRARVEKHLPQLEDFGSSAIAAPFQPA